MHPTNAARLSSLCTSPCSSRNSSARYTVGGAAPWRVARSRSSRSYAPVGASESRIKASTSRRRSVRRAPFASQISPACFSNVSVLGLNPIWRSVVVLAQNSIMTEDSTTIGPSVIANVLEALCFDANGLVPAIAQQHDTGEVLMMAWMNRDAIIETLTTGRVCYWSRSRGRLWRKGETSHQFQHLKEFRIDCDGDTILLQVEQQGVA